MSVNIYLSVLAARRETVEGSLSRAACALGWGVAGLSKRLWPAAGDASYGRSTIDGRRGRLVDWVGVITEPD